MAVKQKKQAYFDLASIQDGVKSPAYILVGSSDLDGIEDNDLLMVDRARTKPRHGDYVVWEKPNGYTVGYYDSDCEYDDDPVYGIGVCLIRRIKRKRRTKAKADPAASLKRKLERLERVPENEAIRFELETEIYNLEHETEEEWPDQVG